MKRKHCCKSMTDEAEFSCPTCEKTLNCPDKLIHYDEEGVYIVEHDTQDKTHKLVMIYFCPWCGKKLISSEDKEKYIALTNRKHLEL